MAHPKHSRCLRKTLTTSSCTAIRYDPKVCMHPIQVFPRAASWENVFRNHLRQKFTIRKPLVPKLARNDSPIINCGCPLPCMSNRQLAVSRFSEVARTRRRTPTRVTGHAVDALSPFCCLAYVHPPNLHLIFPFCTHQSSSITIQTNCVLHIWMHSAPARCILPRLDTVGGPGCIRSPPPEWLPPLPRPSCGLGPHAAPTPRPSHSRGSGRMHPGPPNASSRWRRHPIVAECVQIGNWLVE